jgi:hypothetical protein
MKNPHCRLRMYSGRVTDFFLHETRLLDRIWLLFHMINADTNQERCFF